MHPGSTSRWRTPSDQWWIIAQGALLLAAAVAPSGGPRLATAYGTVRWVALGAGAVGLIAMALGARTLGSSLTILPRPRPEGRLVREGLYRYVRHPIYGGVVALAVGWALYRGSLLHFAFAAAIAVFFDVKARYEERLMTERFPEYAAYQTGTRKFVPWIY